MSRSRAKRIATSFRDGSSRELQRHVTTERRVVRRASTPRHPAGADQLQKQVGPDALPRSVHPTALLGRRGDQGVGLGGPGLDEATNGRGQRGLPPGERIQPGGAGGGWHREALVHQLGDATPIS
jgi:hypothetical protein